MCMRLLVVEHDDMTDLFSALRANSLFLTIPISYFQANIRVESDTMGEMSVPADKYYGAQTARSMMNFPIGDETEKMPVSLLSY